MLRRQPSTVWKFAAVAIGAAAIIVAASACTRAAASSAGGASTQAKAGQAVPADGTVPQAAQPPNELCLACHSKTGVVVKTAAGERLLEPIPAQAFAASAHSGTRCVRCHVDQSAVPHPESVGAGLVAKVIDDTAVCSSCHEDAYEGYSHTAHGIVSNLGDSRAPRCTDCHSAHGVKPIKNWSEQDRGQACAQCHQGADGTFAQASIGHREPSASWFAPSYFAGRFLLVLMASVLAFGTLHVEFDLLRWGVGKVRNLRQPEQDQ